MNLCLINHSFKYELEKLIRIFFPFEKITFFETENITESTAVTILNKKVATSILYFGDKIIKKSYKIDSNSKDIKKESELKLALSLYDCFTELTNYIPEWGILTGVRPAKLFSRLTKGVDLSFAEKYFKETLRVNDKKISLCKASLCGEEKIISLSRPDSFSLYISVPFCPTRCSYCSFVSHSVEKAKSLMPVYVSTLCEELKITADIAARNNLKLETIYIGGGTPTSLDSSQLEKITSTVKQYFDVSHLREYTVEAGRPDTFTVDRLAAIYSGGATRISINPQTMNDNVLNNIGRKHTSEQTIEAFSMARMLGFNNINMDLIAGLPTDTVDGFKNTVEKIIKLNPESITVHSLSMKRSSELNTKGIFPETQAGINASKMVDFAAKRLTEQGIVPYYMYRQSKTVGNLENVGYAKKGFECLYNVYIMDETHTILACGASAVTKLKEPNGNLIERIFNYKYPYEYINNFSELIKRKSGINEFYDKVVKR